MYIHTERDEGWAHYGGYVEVMSDFFGNCLDASINWLEVRLEGEKSLKRMASAKEEVELELEETRASLAVAVNICEKLKSELNEKEKKSNENSIKECLWHPV